MKKEHPYLCILRLCSIVLLFFFILAGCVRDDISGCLRIPTIMVQAVAGAGADPVDPSDVHSLALYVFDKDGEFIALQTANINQTVPLNYPGAGSLHVVAVANLSPENETWTDFTSAQIITSGNISLKQLPDYLSTTLYGSPSDLFWGGADVVNHRRSDEHVTIDAVRITASVDIKIRGLKEFAATTDDNFTVIASADYNTVDFWGIPSGAGTGYSPQGGAFTAANSYSQFEIPAFNIFSSATGADITIAIYHRGVLIDTIIIDDQGNPLTTYNGRLLEVRINYTDGRVTVTLINAQWGQDPVWKEFAGPIM